MNNKTIQVFEHQRLTTASDNRFKKNHLDALLKLNEYHDFKYFEPIVNGIQFNQYVGIIQIDGLTIEILPKADKYDEDNRWRDVLVNILKDCGKIKASSAGAANVNRQNLNLLEVYFELFLLELKALIHHGLIKKYRKKTSNIKSLKGKLEFAGNIRNNIIHKERFYTTHQIYDKNHLLHQILYKALEIVDQISNGTYLSDSCKRVLMDFPKVDGRVITKKTFEQIKSNRKSKPYSYALELARLIILNYSPDISSGKEKMLSLLFDMNKLWEEYITIKLRKELRNSNYTLKSQDKRNFIASNFLKPDIVITATEETEVYIIDTKWKLPSNTASVSDLRQMYTYARFWNAKKVILLYPGNRPNQNFNRFLTDDFHEVYSLPEKINHLCKLAFASVLDSNNELNKNIAVEILKKLDINITN